MRNTVACGCALSLAAFLVPSASLAELPAECRGLAPSAGPVPAELAARCGGASEPVAPRLTPSDMAVSPDGVLQQCASLVLNAPENVTLLGSIPFQPACDFANNDFTKLYCMDFSIPATFVSVDPATCAQTLIGVASNFQNFSGMTWDFTTGTMFGSTTDAATSNLYTIDLTTGATTLVGNMSNSPGNIAIGIDQNGTLYGHDIVIDSLLSYDKSTGAGTVIGPLGFDANFAQGMDFDHSDNTCYIFAFNNTTFQAELRTCDVTNGSTTLVGVIGQNAPGGLQDWTGPGILVNDGGCTAEIEVPGGPHAPGSSITVNVHLVHRRPNKVNVPWHLALYDAEGRIVAKRKLPPIALVPLSPYHGDWRLSLPPNLASGTYRVWLGLPDMAYIKGAMTTIEVVRTPR